MYVGGTMRARPHNKVGVRGSNMRADGVRAFCQPSPAGNGPICKVNAVGVAETGVEHCSPAKNHKVTFLIVFFSLVRKERKGQKEESIPLLISFCRLAATGANKVPRPSDHSIATATGSKRSSADSDLLLCHVRLWRTSRFKLWVRVCVRT